MSILLPVVWMRHQPVFPQMGNKKKDSRLTELQELLARAVPDPVDVMGMLLSFSVRHMMLSQRVERESYPLHVFVFDEASWKGLMGFLGAIISVKGRTYCSASCLSEPLPKKVDATAVSIPPGTSKEEADKLIAQAQASVPKPTPDAPSPVTDSPANVVESA